MAKITIIGLGPGSPDLLTRQAWQVLSRIDALWLRTMRHPVVPHLPPGLEIKSFDELYEAYDAFGDVYAAIVEQVISLARRPEGVTYAVPGHPLVGEATVTDIIQRAKAEAISLRVVAGLSFVEPTLTALTVDALEGVQIVDALDIARLHHPPLNPDAPALIGQLYSRSVASAVKLVLMNQYPDAHPVALVDAAGTEAALVSRLPLYEMDRQDVTPLTSLYIAPLPPVSSFEGFQQTVAHLRAPDGCPWDREQTHKSLRTNLLEEAYEVLMAIDNGDAAALCEELGDLLLQVVLHSQIAVEEGEFYMAEVIAGIDAKLKHRHPHVWGNVHVSGSDDVIVNWEVLKRQEREANGTSERSMLEGVPKALPSLAQAAEYGKRVARVGFTVGAKGIVPGDKVSLTWRDVSSALAVFAAQYAEGAFVQNPDGLDATLGELLFMVANWLHSLGVDAESALRETNARLARQFSLFEAAARRAGVSLDTVNAETLQRLWDEVTTPD